MLEQRSRRLAVLIDAENVAATVIGRVFDDLVRFGEPVVRRAYGDFHGPLGAGWEGVLARHAIMPQHVPSVGKGKNAADIALVVDGMDLMHAGGLDAFVIVSGDSDLAHLTIRLREQHLSAFVYGNKQTPERLRSACTRFVYLENLRFDPVSTAAKPNMKPLRPRSDALPIIRAAITALANPPSEWVDLELLERELERRTTDFDPRTYGHVRLRDLLVALKRPFVVDQSRGARPRVRLRVKKSRTTGAECPARQAPSSLAVDDRALLGSGDEMQVVANEPPLAPPGAYTPRGAAGIRGDLAGSE